MAACCRWENTEENLRPGMVVVVVVVVMVVVAVVVVVIVTVVVAARGGGVMVVRWWPRMDGEGAEGGVGGEGSVMLRLLLWVVLLVCYSCG